MKKIDNKVNMVESRLILISTKSIWSDFMQKFRFFFTKGFLNHIKLITELVSFPRNSWTALG